jgi:hypothetical protein
MIIRYLNENKVFGNYRDKTTPVNGKEQRRQVALSMANDVYNDDIKERMLDIIYNMKVNDADFANTESFITVYTYHFSVTTYTSRPSRGGNNSCINYEVRSIKDKDKNGVHYKVVSLDIPVMLYRSHFLDEGEDDLKKYSGKQFMDVLDKISMLIEESEEVKALGKEYSSRILVKTRLKHVETNKADDLPLSMFDPNGMIVISPKCDNIEEYYNKIEEFFECFSEFGQKVNYLYIDYDKQFAEFDTYIIGEPKSNELFANVICSRFKPKNLVISKFAPNALQVLPDFGKILVPGNNNTVIINPLLTNKQTISEKIMHTVCGKSYAEVVKETIESMSEEDKFSKKDRFRSNPVWKKHFEEAVQILMDYRFWDIGRIVIHLDSMEYEVNADINYQKIEDAFKLISKGKKQDKK